MELRHDEVEELLGAYALDAVDDDERVAVEAHLATCPRCRAEVASHQEVAAHLAQTGAPAPEQLWDRIAEAIAGDPPPPLRLVVDPGVDAPAPPAVEQARRPRWSTLPVRVAAVALVVVGVLAAGLLVGRDDGEGDGGERSELQALALAAFESPQARVAALEDEEGVALARVAVLPDGHGFLLAGALPDLHDRIYQLWGSDGDTVVSLGTLGEAPQIVAFNADPAQTTLMITEEDEPVERSSNPAVVLGELA